MDNSGNISKVGVVEEEKERRGEVKYKKKKETEGTGQTGRTGSRAWKEEPDPPVSVVAAADRPFFFLFQRNKNQNKVFGRKKKERARGWEIRKKKKELEEGNKEKLWNIKRPVRPLITACDGLCAHSDLASRHSVGNLFSPFFF